MPRKYRGARRGGGARKGNVTLQRLLQMVASLKQARQKSGRRITKGKRTRGGGTNSIGLIANSKAKVTDMTFSEFVQPFAVQHTTPQLGAAAITALAAVTGGHTAYTLDGGDLIVPAGLTACCWEIPDSIRGMPRAVTEVLRFGAMLRVHVLLEIIPNSGLAFQGQAIAAYDTRVTVPTFYQQFTSDALALAQYDLIGRKTGAMGFRPYVSVKIPGYGRDVLDNAAVCGRIEDSDHAGQYLPSDVFRYNPSQGFYSWKIGISGIDASYTSGKTFAWAKCRLTVTVRLWDAE